LKKPNQVEAGGGFAEYAFRSSDPAANDHPSAPRDAVKPLNEDWRLSEMKKSTVLAPIAFTALAVLAIGAAMAQDVRYNFDKKTDFSKFKTYKWVEIKDASKFNSLVDQDIKQAVDAQLATKGLTKTDADNADLLIGYQGAVGQEKQFSSYNSSWGYGPGWGGGGWYGGGPTSGWTTGQTSTIYVGQIAIDMYDSANKDLVWRGTVSKTIDPKAKPDKQEKNLNKAMAKLFKKYPPEVKSS
jgi:Domain of unknown function (DUF4136)